jgi:hypothetical protein
MAPARQTATASTARERIVFVISTLLESNFTDGMISSAPHLNWPPGGHRNGYRMPPGSNRRNFHPDFTGTAPILFRSCLALILPRSISARPQNS